jgi:nucleoside-diphosphate-sugar epimerase
MGSLRVLLLGHGYLGTSLAADLLAAGDEVVAVHRGEPQRGPYPLLSGDVSLPGSLVAVREGLPFARPDAIVHCASSSRGGAETYEAVFVEGMRNLRAIFPGVPVLFTSSTSVYGQTDGSVVDESSDTTPDRETGRLLLEAEALARGSGGMALRLAGIYGPGRSVHLKKLLEGSAAIEDVDPSRYLNQIHRDDASGAIRHLLHHGPATSAGATFNVVDDTPVTQRECYEKLAACFGLPVPPLAPPDPARKRGWTHKIVSNAALRATGWAPRYPSFLGAVETDPRLVPSIRGQIATVS